MGVSGPTQSVMAQLPGCVMSVVFFGVAQRDYSPFNEMLSAVPVGPVGSDGR